MIHRPRRLRATAAHRRLVREHSLRTADLILPMFVREGLEEPQPISSLPGVVQHNLTSLRGAAREAAELGLGGIMLFGVPEQKDATGSGGVDPDGILNRALREVRTEVGDDILVMSDLCLDEFTDHGHCGVLGTDGTVDNDATLEVYAEMARQQADAGAHIVAPSGMMDGQVRVIRDALDEHGRTDVGIYAYTAKYSSAFYGPFREAVNSSLTGDRRTYQQDSANSAEALRELELDVAEGADLVMVKPGLPYLDVLSQVAEASPVPVGVYQVSGEYAMIEAASANGWLDRDRTVLESLLAFKRAGASSVLTYYAAHAARLLRERPDEFGEYL
ncbi:porphobilinogen synthase [Helcobacillus sp. ACRRO]|uniref:porphobilinogen synthase n=1 Tax=Helcobacillus sp. ACRRO TaxID=2918202 RepID=UPI001EF53700|nr:porphobilinogen synthase [Helcobacillus sp. ACRRO]MCG7427026.1 porphobilinogen synthase [Helcobacillus sp. ACRRO]